jgi:predicted metal-dependent phosphoesterase TrpH
MKTNSLLILFLLLEMISFAQNMNNVKYTDMKKVSVRNEIKLPEVMGYQFLKCDFHMHTIFSDGTVWPTFRVEEAWEEGLDAIAITDHLENQPSKKYVSGDHNSSYQMALEEAKARDILLIHGTEITRSMPPGHLNALFLTDANQLIKSSPTEVLEAAKKQGAFILWNHPGWKPQQPDSCRWMPLHQELFEKGLINGIEVFNEQEFYPVALDWCINRNLTVFCNSDIHGLVSHFYNLETSHRPMTLVLARDRSVDCIREALFDKQTLAYFDNILAGKEELLKAFFEGSVSIKPTGKSDSKKRELFKITNISSIPFDLANKKGDKILIPALATVVLPLNRNDCKEMIVNNLFTGSKSYLEIDLFDQMLFVSK